MAFGDRVLAKPDPSVKGFSVEKRAPIVRGQVCGNACVRLRRGNRRFGFRARARGKGKGERERRRQHGKALRRSEFGDGGKDRKGAGHNGIS